MKLKSLISFDNKEKTPSRHPSLPFGNHEEKDRTYLLFAMISTIMLILVGCSDETHSSNEYDSAEAGNIAAILSDIYAEAVSTDTLGSLDTAQRMVGRLGENGYVAVDSENQVDMTRAEQVLEFCKAVDRKENAEMTIITITEQGFRTYDLQTKDGNVNIVRGYYQYDPNGYLQNRSKVSYPADFWQYTKEGYLIFEGSYFSDENFALTLSNTPEHTMLRVLPLDEKCRELNRKYILPVGYGQNNLFLCNWSGEDYGDLDFYDLFDRFYPIMYGHPVPYVAGKNLGVSTVYQIPEKIFENVIRTYFNVDDETLHSKTTYVSEIAAYEYRPRSFYEAEYPDIPYPEVVRYTENPDGTVTLHINAVYPNGNTSKEFTHTTVVHPLKEGGYQYVSNEMGFPFATDGTQGYPEDRIAEENYNIWWHSDRLTQEEREKLFPNEAYGGNES